MDCFAAAYSSLREKATNPELVQKGRIGMDYVQQERLNERNLTHLWP